MVGSKELWLCSAVQLPLEDDVVSRFRVVGTVVSRGDSSVPDRFRFETFITLEISVIVTPGFQLQFRVITAWSLS